jgi:hypothetical protein
LERGVVGGFGRDILLFHVGFLALFSGEGCLIGSFLGILG